MFNRVPLAWLQLANEKARLFAAIAGIAFTVVLMLFQIGLRDALFVTASLVQSRLKGDLVLTSTQYQYLVYSKNFSRRRIYQVLAFDGVESVKPVYLGVAEWRNPELRTLRAIIVLGLDPLGPAFTLPADVDSRRLFLPDTVLFDSASRTEFGPVAKLLHERGAVETEVNGRKITVIGLFRMGASFGIDGTLVTSDASFLRMFPAHPRDLVELGMINLKPGADPERVRQAIQDGLPPDVRVLTRANFEEEEKNYWKANTGIGYIFSLGVVIGFVVGAVIVYQILYTGVNDHLAEFATLKALGYRDSYLSLIVLRQALVLSIFGFIPGVLMANELYLLTSTYASLQMTLDPRRVLLILILTIGMCAGSAMLAVRKLRQANPADIF
jgi:putative ABC transport system permease protein